MGFPSIQATVCLRPMADNMSSTDCYPLAIKQYYSTRSMRWLMPISVIIDEPEMWGIAAAVLAIGGFDVFIIEDGKAHYYQNDSELLSPKLINSQLLAVPALIGLDSDICDDTMSYYSEILDEEYSSVPTL